MMFSYRLGLIFVALALVYVGSYVILSINGKYGPHSWGLQHYRQYKGLSPKSWIWIPYGFESDDGTFNSVPLTLYAPLFWIDKEFIHNKRVPDPKVDSYDTNYDKYFQ